MQIKEKLEVFRQSAIEVAGQESKTELEEYEKTYNQELEWFKKSKQQEIENAFEMERMKINREMNRKVSAEITRQKRILEECQQQKKQKLFEVVEKKLAEYQKTESYEAYLIAQIKKALIFARDEEMIIYINPTDAEKKQRLEQQTGAVLTISNMDFGGGIRAVIHSKNILIDESFATRLEQEKNSYTF